VVAGGKIYVGDAGNNRVLVYNTIPTTNGSFADMVIGQPNFTTTSGGTTATNFNSIQQLAVTEN
jgi:hypothetical protein